MKIVKRVLFVIIAVLFINTFAICCYRTAHAGCQDSLNRVRVIAKEDASVLDLNITAPANTHEYRGEIAVAVSKALNEHPDARAVHVVYSTKRGLSQWDTPEDVLFSSGVFRILMLYGYSEVLAARPVWDYVEFLVVRGEE